EAPTMSDISMLSPSPIPTSLLYDRLIICDACSQPAVQYQRLIICGAGSQPAILYDRLIICDAGSQPAVLSFIPLSALTKI
ncbi:MAG: hypothetical protein AAF639_28780, partial [Chloroflexota bacterium]